MRSAVPVRHRVSRASALALAFTLAVAHAQSADPQGVSQPPAPPSAAVPHIDPNDLAAVSAKLNEITTLEANFTQVDAQGTATGRFYLSRPGGMRFEYNPPRKVLVVADNHTVAVQENPNASPYRARVDDTPLRLLLKPNIDLSRDASITDVHRDGDQLYVTAVQTKGYAQGQATFVFAEPSLDLERWSVVDAMGAQTVVTLRDVQAGAVLSDALFEVPSIKTDIGPPR